MEPDNTNQAKVYLPDELLVALKDAGFDAWPDFPYIIAAVHGRNVYPYEVAIALDIDEAGENKMLCFDGMVAIPV